MNILLIVLAVVAALIAFRCGKVFYRSSKFWGLLGVIVMSFAAAWLLLNGLNESLRTFVTTRSLWSGFGISSLIALASLFCGGCTDCKKSKRPRHTTHTHDVDTRRSSHKSVHTNSAVAGSAAATHYDDLKKIEGIGPVLENHLHEHGYHTFNDVAQADAAALKQVLNLGGDRFAIHNPESRPQQAMLCAQGARDDLAAYKATLTAGRIS